MFHERIFTITVSNASVSFCKLYNTRYDLAIALYICHKPFLFLYSTLPNNQHMVTLHWLQNMSKSFHLTLFKKLILQFCFFSAEMDNPTIPPHYGFALSNNLFIPSKILCRLQCTAVSPTLHWEPIQTLGACVHVVKIGSKKLDLTLISGFL